MPMRKHEMWLGVSDRMLEKEVRGSGWIMFRSVYWALFAMSIFGLLLYYSANEVTMPLQAMYGIAFIMLATAVLLYGLAEVPHRILMRSRG